MLGTYAILNGWADSAPKGVAQHLRAGTPARMGGVWSVLCTRTNSGSCHGRLHVPGRCIYRCMYLQQPHRTEYVFKIVPLVCPGQFSIRLA